jgi:hypothetical protein
MAQSVKRKELKLWTDSPSVRSAPGKLVQRGIYSLERIKTFSSLAEKKQLGPQGILF